MKIFKKFFQCLLKTHGVKILNHQTTTLALAKKHKKNKKGKNQKW